MKKRIISFVAGAVLFGTAGVFAGQYMATPNPFPIQLNGNNVYLEGYNIDGSTYFKLRDISSIVGGFNVDFNNNTIQLSKDGYVYYSYNKYNNMGYVNTSGNTIDMVADQMGMTLAEFLAEYSLPADMPADTEETAAYYQIPFWKFVEMNGYTIAEFRVQFGISSSISDYAPWGDVEATITLDKYIGEESFADFKEIYGFGDDVTLDTKWGEIRTTVHLADKAAMEAEATAGYNLY